MTTVNYPGGPGVGSGSGSQSGAKEQAQQAAGTAKEEGKHVAGVAQEEARRVAGEAKSQAQGLLSQVTSQVDEQSSQQKDRLASTLRSVSDDLEQMASQGNAGPAADLTRAVADRARSISSSLESKQPNELLEDLRDFARRKPGTFLLSALAAGVVAGRLTRGAREAQSQGSGSAYGTAGYDYDSGAYDTAEPYRTGTLAGTGAAGTSGVLAGDVTSPGDPYTTGADAPSSGSVSGAGGTGAATGDPLAGTGTPTTPPVYPDEGTRP